MSPTAVALLRPSPPPARLPAADWLAAASGPGSAAEAVGERIAAWLRPWPAKVIAREFGVEPRTAKAWRQGSLPQMRHLVAMVDRWGVAFLEDAFAPVLGELPAEMRLERVERDLAAVRAGLAALARAPLAAPSRDRRTPADDRFIPPAPVDPARAAGRGPGGAGLLAPEAGAHPAGPARGSAAGRGRLARHAARLLAAARGAVCLALVLLSSVQLAGAEDVSALRPGAARGPVRIVRGARDGGAA